MAMLLNGRAYFQRRLREEIARCSRYHDVFSVVTLQATPGPGFQPNQRLTETAARLLERHLRTSDVVDAVDEETIAIVFTGTGKAGLQDAEMRLRAALMRIGGAWRMNEYVFPEQAQAIQSLQILNAA
jgi:GGDEF domain-containing protein